MHMPCYLGRRIGKISRILSISILTSFVTISSTLSAYSTEFVRCAVITSLENLSSIISSNLNVSLAVDSQSCKIAAGFRNCLWENAGLFIQMSDNADGSILSLRAFKERQPVGATSDHVDKFLKILSVLEGLDGDIDARKFRNIKGAIIRKSEGTIGMDSSMCSLYYISDTHEQRIGLITPTRREPKQAR